jgi:phosphopantothenoylcysteine decarboxylase
MANILLGVTGSVAAIKTPDLFAELTRRGHAVKVVATAASLYFFDAAALDPTPLGAGLPTAPRRNPEIVILDEDEWPGDRYQRSDTVLHIELRRWADLLLIAPLDANTLGKLAAGLCDNCLTCIWRAWDLMRPVVLAPAMNTLMWQHPATLRHLRQLAADAGAEPPLGVMLDDMPDWINSHCARLRVVSPISKRLACDDVGIGAMAEVGEVAAVVDESVRR